MLLDYILLGLRLRIILMLPSLNVDDQARGGLILLYHNILFLFVVENCSLFFEFVDDTGSCVGLQFESLGCPDDRVAAF